MQISRKKHDLQECQMKNTQQIGENDLQSRPLQLNKEFIKQDWLRLDSKVVHRVLVLLKS
jgi:hypothetical protein